MKCNENVNLSYCGEHLSVSSGQCGTVGIVAEGINFKGYCGYLRGIVVEPYKASWCPFVE